MYSKRRQLTAWSGLFLLTINLIAGALMPAQAASPASQLAQQAYICTAFGMQAIGLDGDGEQDGQAGGHSAFCSFCLPLLQGGLDAPPANPAESIVFFENFLENPTPVSFAAARPDSSHNPAAPRAPPAV